MPISRVLERLLAIKTFTRTTKRIVFIDDVNRKVLERMESQSLDGDSIYFGELKDFPYSHHIT